MTLTWANNATDRRTTNLDAMSNEVAETNCDYPSLSLHFYSKNLNVMSPFGDRMFSPGFFLLSCHLGAHSSCAYVHLSTAAAVKRTEKWARTYFVNKMIICCWHSVVARESREKYIFRCEKWNEWNVNRLNAWKKVVYVGEGKTENKRCEECLFPARRRSVIVFVMSWSQNIVPYVHIAATLLIHSVQIANIFARFSLSESSTMARLIRSFKCLFVWFVYQSVEHAIPRHYGHQPEEAKAKITIW